MTFRLALCLSLLLPCLAAAQEVEHRLEIQIEPSSHRLVVTDHLKLPKDHGRDFLLAAELELIEPPEAVREVALGDLKDLLASDEEPMLELRRYRVEAMEGDSNLVLHYEGELYHGLSEQKEEYTRGFRDSAGIVGDEGIYLAGSTFWYPNFGPGLVKFELEAKVPDGWHLISQGNGTSRDEEGKANWTSDLPMDEIYLVGGPLLRYQESAGAVQALVYIHEEDSALAGKYLQATAQYLEMYRGLIGTYPYEKFALVENFWETGFGMPSFTLLGPAIVRFPFILHSSYPHEILHNWWGNSVFVEWQEGNWSEGLTAYLADHLIQEQRGLGEAYRRDTLQKYRSYVGDGSDFPLTEFRSRHSASTEAVGYGKTLMFFHMLRHRIGDDAFRLTLSRFYRKYRGKRASFADLATVASEASGEDLTGLFSQWVERIGAPELRLASASTKKGENGWLVEGRLEQIQKLDAFALDIPVRIQTESGIESRSVPMVGRNLDLKLEVQSRPLSIRIDPAFDLFRILDPREMPSSIGQIFGAETVLAVLPDRDADPYRDLLEAWRTGDHQIEERLESEVESIPEDRMVWIFGEQNRWAQSLFSSTSEEDIELAKESVGLAGEAVAFEGHSLVVLRRHPANPELAIGWITLDNQAAGPGLARKLPHYGKYSYLAFEGDEPTNVVKGQWNTNDSPLRADLRPESERSTTLPSWPTEAREALAELPPVFSEKGLLEHVSFLASMDLGGRGLGTPGLDKAAAYIIEIFEAAGLEPAGDDGSYLQRFELPKGPDGNPVQVANIVGKVPGTKEAFSGQTVVLSAHYDHLGDGWPDAHAGDEGKVHPGADDNASGVAVLLELLRVFADGEGPQRSLTIAAFTAEEAGLAGSRHWIQSLSSSQREGIFAAVNLDTVGRMATGKLSVLGTGTATEWPHIVRGVGFVSGIEARSVPEMTDASDQGSFIERGIPAVQVFTGAHEDYHRPSDTADKIDGAGLVQVATLTKEVVSYLLEREESLSSTLQTSPAAAAAIAAPPESARKVRLGTLPDFAFQGEGVRVESVSEGSPAASAGILAGDILLSLAGRNISDLRSYSEILKTLDPGSEVTTTILRGEEMLELKISPEAR